jgi:hypothetical protein
MLLIVTASILGTFALGCAPSLMHTASFEPRVYPYVPQLGPDGPQSEK